MNLIYRENEEFEQQSKWRELELQQLIQAGEQKITGLKEESLQLSAKVKDLRVYSAALRKGDTKPEHSSRPSSRSSVSGVSAAGVDVAGVSAAGVEVVEQSSEPLRNESGSFTPINWRDLRFHSSLSRRRKTSGVSIDKSPLSMSLNSSLDFSHSSLSTRREGGSNPSRPGSSMLPPINLTQSVGRPQFRQQMRLSSAPPTETKALNMRRRIGSETTLPRRKFTE